MKDLLVLTITYKCDLNCSYCPIIKNDKNMSWDIAKKSLDLFNNLRSTNPRIKFFGGEPLLEFDLIKKCIDYNKDFNKEVKYELTTNGTLLNKDKLRFFKKHGFEFHVSIDGDRITQISERGIKAWKVFKMLDDKDKQYVIVNMVISPNQVEKFYENFRFLFKNEFKKFNFLPAFFNKWSDKELIIFHNELKKIANFIKGKDIWINNKFIQKDEYLFNDGYVIDWNGDIYTGNKVMIKQYEKMKYKFKIGNILNLNNFKGLKNELNFECKDKEHLINLKLDRILSNFIENI